MRLGEMERKRVRGIQKVPAICLKPIFRSHIHRQSDIEVDKSQTGRKIREVNKLKSRLRKSIDVAKGR